MEVVILVLILVVAVLISNVIASKVTQVPLAFIEIAMGLLMAFVVPFYRHYTMNPELFMLAVLAPLMFYEGLNTNASLTSFYVNNLLAGRRVSTRHNQYCRGSGPFSTQ